LIDVQFIKNVREHNCCGQDEQNLLIFYLNPASAGTHSALLANKLTKKLSNLNVQHVLDGHNDITPFVTT